MVLGCLLLIGFAACGSRTSGEAEADFQIHSPQAADANDVAADSEPSLASGASFLWPVSGQQWWLSCRFGETLEIAAGEPFLHRGIDIAAPRGTPVRSSGAGVVGATGFERDGAGYYCLVNHENGFSSFYSHLAEDPCVVIGEAILQGRIIGHIGSTGVSTGPHLHFEIRLNGQALDPEQYVKLGRDEDT